MILEPGITIVDQIEIPEANISLRSDSIVHVHFNKDTVFDVALQLRMRRIYDKLLKGRKAKFIFSADEGFILTKEAREYVPDPGNEPPILCYVLIVNNLAYKIVADFYIRVVKPKGNFKLVGSLDEAVEWLGTIKD
jgi:hypothetical protein